jgi:hypothetical protein
VAGSLDSGSEVVHKVGLEVGLGVDLEYLGSLCVVGNLVAAIGS